MSVGLKVREAKFRFAAAKQGQLPELSLPELCLIGRSNVGKSTLINRLTGRADLARVSNTPGRTTEIIGFEILFTNKTRLILADLPGYGFAKLPLTQRRALATLIDQYVMTRQNLVVVCLLNDIRRDPEEEEIGLVDQILESGKSFLIVATKADKINKNEQKQRLKELAEAYNINTDQIVLAGQNISATQIWGAALSLF